MNIDRNFPVDIPGKIYVHELASTKRVTYILPHVHITGRQTE
jgi:hypothetical protein